MIKHHPKFELIQAYVNGDLPASLSAGIAMHAELCEVCQQTIAQFTEHIAESNFETEDDLSATIVGVSTENTDSSLGFSLDQMFDEMIDGIVQSSDIDVAVPLVHKTMDFKGKTYSLPTALNSMSMGKKAHIGKLTRARVQLNENEIRTSLLHIQPGGGVPEHTHKGFELTLLLDGSFHDDNGKYVKGDFIMLDSSHQHNPISTNGCLCYTVANDALHFTQGINKLLNPIGAFIY